MKYDGFSEAYDSKVSAFHRKVMRFLFATLHAPLNSHSCASFINMSANRQGTLTSNPVDGERELTPVVDSGPSGSQPPSQQVG